MGDLTRDWRIAWNLVWVVECRMLGRSSRRIICRLDIGFDIGGDVDFDVSSPDEGVVGLLPPMKMLWQLDARLMNDSNLVKRASTSYS